MTEPWESYLDRYLEYAARFREPDEPPTTPPATTEQLAFLHSEGRRQNLFIDPCIERLLTRVNGTGYDGLCFYGIHIPSLDVSGRLDFLYMNLLIEERGQDTLYGQWAEEFFVQVADTGTFARRSIAGWRPYFTYETCSEMIAAILEEAVGYLDEHHGKA